LGREVGPTRSASRRGQAAKAVIEEAARKPIAEGYGAIDPERYGTVVVQYQLASWGSVDDLDRRRKIEEVLYLTRPGMRPG
jgi:hypothetical protein